MAIGTLTETLRSENGDVSDVVEAISKLSVQVKVGFDGLSKSLKSSKITLKMPKFKIPGVASLTRLLTDNILVKTIRGFYSQAVSFITSPFKLLQSSLVGIKNVFKKGLSFLGNGLKRSLGAIGSLFGLNKKDATLNAILDEVVATKQALLDYVEYLKRGELDKLENKLEGKKKSGKIARDNVTPGSETSNKFSFIPTGLLRIATAPITGFLIAAGATFYGFDTGIRALRMIGSKSFDRIGKAIAGIGNLLGKSIKGLAWVFAKLAPKNLLALVRGATVGRDAVTGRFTPRPTPGRTARTIVAVSGTLVRIKTAIAGFMDFLSPLGKFASGIMKPLKMVATVLRGVPFLGFFISLFDFIGGAFKGFTETQGSLGVKLLGALEGGLLGVIKGFTQTFDLLYSAISYVPRKILEALGFEKLAKALGDFNITSFVDPLWKSIKYLFTSPGEAFTLIGSLVKDLFLLQTTKLGNVIDGMFHGAIKFFKDIPDKIAIMAENMNFSVPKIEVPVPNFLGGGKFTLMDGFTVGLGSKEGGDRARSNIAVRERAFAERVSQNRGETALILERLAETSAAFQRKAGTGSAVVQTNVDSRSSNSSTTVLSSGSLPSTIDREDAIGPI